MSDLGQLCLRRHNSESGSAESSTSATQDADPDSESEQQYTADEDDNPGMWAFLTIPLAVAIANLCGVGQCHRAVRLLQDLHWSGFEDVEEVTRRSWLVATCPLCGLAPDTQDHGVLRCPHQALQVLRLRTFEVIHAVIDSLPMSHQWAASKIADMARAEGGYHLYLGIWTSSHIQMIDHPDYVLDKDQIPAVLWAVYLPLAKMVSDVWIEGASLPPPPPPASYPPFRPDQLATPRIHLADGVSLM